MSGKFCLTDYISDIQLEIGPNFLPLPEVQIPQEDITLRVPLYEYSFSAEQKYYDFIQKDANQQTSSTPTNTAPPDPSPNPTLSNGKNAYEMFKLMQVPKPSPLSNESSQQKTPEQSTNTSYNELSEFEEHGKNVFDLMELKSINEKLELEKLWG